MTKSIKITYYADDEGMVRQTPPLPIDFVADCRQSEGITDVVDIAAAEELAFKLNNRAALWNAVDRLLQAEKDGYFSFKKYINPSQNDEFDSILRALRAAHQEAYETMSDPAL